MEDNRGVHLSIEDLNQLRWRLIWIYSGPLDQSKGALRYCAYPTAAWLIQQGAVHLHFPSGTESYAAGQWVFPRQAEGLQSFSPDTKILSVRFQAEWPDGAPLFERHRTVVAPDDDEITGPLKRHAMNLLGFLEQRVPDQIDSRQLSHLSMDDYLKMQPLVSEWVYAYFQAMVRCGIPASTRNSHDKVNHALRLLQSQPLDRPIRIQNLAEEVGLSVSQLNKVFVRETGETPAAFWHERRLNAARSWLLYGSQSMKVIARDLGFSSSGNFSQWFRSGTGCSPKLFRESQLHL